MEITLLKLCPLRKKTGGAVNGGQQHERMLKYMSDGRAFPKSSY